MRRNTGQSVVELQAAYIANVWEVASEMRMVVIVYYMPIRVSYTVGHRWYYADVGRSGTSCMMQGCITVLLEDRVLFSS